MENQQIYFTSPPYKSMAASILLTVFLGPLGLLYSSFVGGLIMTILIIPGLFIPIPNNSVYFIISVLWLACLFWGAFATTRYNKKLYKNIVNKQ